jgi:hypothetical protein
MDGVEEWISTGKAAAMLDYKRWSFRRKFLGIIPHRRIGRNYQWNAKAVLELSEKNRDEVT